MDHNLSYYNNYSWKITDQIPYFWEPFCGGCLVDIIIVTAATATVRYLSDAAVSIPDGMTIEDVPNIWAAHVSICHTE